MLLPGAVLSVFCSQEPGAWGLEEGLRVGSAQSYPPSLPVAPLWSWSLRAVAERDPGLDGLLAPHSPDGGVGVVHDDAEILQGHVGVLLHHRQAGALARPQGLILPLQVRDLRLGPGGAGRGGQDSPG